MAYDHPVSGSLKRKRRRRRREDKPALSARLYLDGTLKGDTGVLSPDLLAELFPGGRINPESSEGETLYAALTPWTPNASPIDSSWTILPFRAPLPHEKTHTSTIRFPASSVGSQSFVRIVHALSPTRTLRQNTSVDVRITDVIPLPLDTLFVSVDTDAIQKLEDVQKRYGGGFGSAPAQVARRAGKRALPEAQEELDIEDKVKNLLQDVLIRTKVVHTDDFLPLPLTHPVTHTPAPPARILASEPVSQGVISSSTNIVIVPSTEKRLNAHGNKSLLSARLDEESGEEDTANEAFYSATEENSPAKPVVTSKSATDFSNSDDLFDSSAEESNLSDDDDDMISLAKPGLSDAPSGLSSALTSATPRPFGIRTHGINTPGSVFSNLTSTTIRGGQATRRKIFRAQGLVEKITNELLHPKPPLDEDEEARVYVDAQALARLGCFSGDWVKIEGAESHFLPSLHAFGDLDNTALQQWRPVKVYTLPESMSKRPQRYQVNNRQRRRDSISSLTTNASTTPVIYLSPVLLANMQEPNNISMSPMPKEKRPSLKRPMTPRPASAAARLPPTASEVTLRKVVTPISTERSLNNALFAKLKQYFEEKRRIIKPGDLIAIQVDESLGRSVYEGEVEQDGSSAAALLCHTQDQAIHSPATTNVAWFSIEEINVSQTEELDGQDREIWGDSATIDPAKIQMRQSGDERRKLPSATSSTWRYYLGLRKLQAKLPSSVAATGVPEMPQSYVSQLQRRLRELMSVSISPRAVHLGMPPLTILLYSTQRNIGKTSTVIRACADLGIHFFPIDARDIVSESGTGVDVQAQGLLEARCERAMDCGPDLTALCLTHLEVFSDDRVASSLKDVLTTARVLVATTTDIDKVPDTLRGLFTHELDMSAPDEGEREGILRDVITNSGIPLAAEVDLSSIAVKTAALVGGDLVDVVDRAIVAKNERIETLAQSKAELSETAISVKDIQLAGGSATNSVISADFDAAVDLARKNFADSIGAPKIPNVQWSDVGGLTNVKDAVIETIQLPLSRPELFAKGLKKRSGILFYGPPGTGKTLLAKAIATEFSLNFFSVKGPELLNMYIGESEANVRRVFQRARDARPCVVFFDELDSVAPKRGNQGDSGGVMDRIVSQMLAELDGMSDGEESGGGVFVIGATNRPDLLDQALLRPGRFDKMLYLGISDTHEKQATILQALSRKFTLDPSVSLARVSETLSFTFTGADLYALCSDAMLKAVTRSARAVDQRVSTINLERASRGQSKISVAYYFDHYSSEADTQVMVTEEDYIRARQELVPSVSLDELHHYERVRDTFEGKAQKTNGNVEPQRPFSPQKGRPNGTDTDRARAAEGMKRITKAKAPMTNGGDHSHTQSRPTTSRPTTADADNGYVVRTDRLSLNDVSTRASPTKAKGKGKSREAVEKTDDADGDYAADTSEMIGEDLYD